MEQIVHTVEEADAIVSPLIAENKWAITVVQQTGGDYLIQWTEHKKYTAQDGKEFLDEVWTNKEGEMMFIQDMETEHVRNVVRMLLRNNRRVIEDMDKTIKSMTESIMSGEFDDEEDELLPYFEMPEKKTIH